MDELQYNEIIDEAEDQYDDQQEIQEGQLESFGTYPQKDEKSDLYNWFWKVVKLGKLSKKGEEGFNDESLRLVKVGNLDRKEIGEFNTSVRDCLNLANLGNIFGHEKFGDYFQSVAMITSATSMARKGWFMDLSISQKKVRERARESSSSGEQKWRLFNKNKTRAAGGE